MEMLFYGFGLVLNTHNNPDAGPKTETFNITSNAEFTLHDFQSDRIIVVFTLRDYLG